MVNLPWKRANFAPCEMLMHYAKFVSAPNTHQEMNQGLHLLAPNFAPCEIHANLGGNFVELDFFSQL
jgi:hypothetical protein